MSGWGDMAADVRSRKFLEQWAPDGSWEHVEATPENLRHNIARARAAQDELDKIRAAMRLLVRVGSRP